VRWGIGTDNVDFEAARRLGLPVINTPGMFGREVADLALHYLTGLARRTFEIDRGMRAGAWTKIAGTSLAGLPVGLVGYGDIGRNFARRAAAAEIALTVYDPGMGQTDVAPHRLARWPDGLGGLRALVLTCALTGSSRGMLDAEALATLPEGAWVVNVARGGLIDERALEAALASGQVGAAALDVFGTEPLPESSPLRAHPRCILGSHNGSNTVEAVERASHRAMEILAGFLSETAQRR
jgi:D-3-phosphoglycerate dehydrogenase